nr:DEAD/DEAH box helicase [Raoultibacter phocaeensis]
MRDHTMFWRSTVSTTFQDLGLSETTLKAVEKMGFTTPTPVQEQAIPLALEGRDVVAAATTGTGKTAAFALPLIERIGHAKRPGSPRALVVSPTRELAQQIDAACTELAKGSGHRMLTVVGGVPYKGQLAKLKKGIDILVATPGRLYDLMERGNVKLKDVEVLVLDEADRMLDMGFWPTMKKVVAATPKTRQTLLFSATLDRKVMQNVSPILKDPAFVEVSHKGETADTVDQFIIPIGQMKKPELLRAVLEERGSKRVIIFTGTKTRSEICMNQLKRAGYRVDSIHSDKTQSQRKRALDNFSKGDIDVLIATDVLARGIDVSNIDYVINYDLPDNPEDYVHRIGRTGRAGETGYAISFVSPEAKPELLEIEKLLDTKIPLMHLESYDTSEAEAELKNHYVPKSNQRSAAAFSHAMRGRGRGRR